MVAEKLQSNKFESSEIPINTGMNLLHTKALYLNSFRKVESILTIAL